MICAVMQPTYFPWIGYFDLIDRVDRFVFLDNVKLEKSDWHVRNRIKSADGEVFLTVNVSLPKGRMETMINEARLEYQRPWPQKHLKSIKYSYRKAPYHNEVFSFLEGLLSKEDRSLGDLNIRIIETIAQKLGIKTEFFISSQMEGLKGVKDARLVEICRKVQCVQYLSPQGSAVYLEKEKPGGELVSQGISLFYQNYEHPQYLQLYKPFKSHLSIIDLLFNVGFKDSITIIRQGRRPAYDYLAFRKKMLKLDLV